VNDTRISTATIIIIMGGIDNAINELRKALTEKDISFGGGKFVHPPPELPINAVLQQWLKSVGENDLQVRWIFEWLTIYGSGQLANHQVGYRWLSEDRRTTAKGWNYDWVVIGDCGGDAIIAEMSNVNIPVFYALHGMGEWQPHQLASSLGVFVTFLATWVEVVGGKSKAELRNKAGDFNMEVLIDIREHLGKRLERMDVMTLMSFVESAI
jgi:hypothetical protein